MQLLDETLKTFNDLENNVLNTIELNKEKIKEQIIEEEEEKEIEKKEGKGMDFSLSTTGSLWFLWRF